MLDVGVIVSDRYEIVGRVGSGGMADVYKAKDHKLNRFVAIKVLKAEFGSDTTFISKFQREAQAAAGLAHPNIVNVFDVGEDNGINYIVMELVEGITLKEYISKKGRLTIKETTSIAIQVAMGLEAAHNKKIVHRDIKPQNIIISTDGKVKVTDFGIARAASSNTISTNAMGSVHYSSPEQVRGGYSDYKSDIYSLGITMYEMVTGTVPFDGDTTVSIAIKHLQEEMIPPSELNPQLPHSLEEIIMKCTQKSPDRRYNSLAELISDLKQSLIDPDGNFVNLTPLSNHAQTVVISPEEMEQIKRGAVAAGNTVPESNPEVNYEDFEIPDEDEYIDNNADYDYKDDVDDYDAEGEEPHKKGISHTLEKVMTIGGIVVGAIIICVLVYTIASASGLLKSGSSKNNNSGNTTASDSKSEKDSDSSVKQVEVPDLTNKTPEEAQKTLNDLQLGYKNGGEEASDSVAEGNICRQDVETGTKVEPYTQITCYISSKSEKDSDSSVKQVEVPDLTNKTPEEAQKTLNDLQLGYKNGGEEASDSVAEGNICRQDVEAGTKVEPYTQITCYISSGTEEIQVPNVTDYSQTDAEAMLKELGLKTAVQKANSSDITIGNVVSTDPEAGTSVKAGDTVTLTISIGEGDTAVRVPNVIGTSEADAKSTLSQLGLLVSVQTGNDQSVNEGEVYKQSVDSGTRVNTGETITIYVRSSSSSDDEDSEDSKTDKDKNKDKDKNSSSSADGTWKPANSLQQPTNYQGGKVKVELVQTDDDGNTYSDQSMEVDDPQFPLSIQDLNGHPGITSGTVVLYEWIDDSYQIIDQYDVSFRQVN